MGRPKEDQRALRPARVFESGKGRKETCFEVKASCGGFDGGLGVRGYAGGCRPDGDFLISMGLGGYGDYIWGSED